MTASGEIVATRYADIGSNVMGKIVALPVKEGDRVKAGQVLARIDPVQARAELSAASAGVEALAGGDRGRRRRRCAPRGPTSPRPRRATRGRAPTWRA